METLNAVTCSYWCCCTGVYAIASGWRLDSWWWRWQWCSCHPKATFLVCWMPHVCIPSSCTPLSRVPDCRRKRRQAERFPHEVFGIFVSCLTSCCGIQQQQFSSCWVKGEREVVESHTRTTHTRTSARSVLKATKHVNGKGQNWTPRHTKTP